MRHVVDGFVHSLYDCWGQRLSHVADTQADDVSLRVCGLEGIDLLRYVGEEVVLLQL